ncbi:MAG: putative manganese-dependent inorganic diphosphatase [Lachnospiraceae bacterium]|nr:putative manganese-dependent inorganic diphosphatase [Candidatus Equihabitans merdae]
MVKRTKKRPVFVVGHKDPDTDSICAAIAYADIKNRTDEGLFKACRAGQLSDETKFVLDYFNMPRPDYLINVGLQVRDMQIRETPGVEAKISVKEAWKKMDETSSRTLPITDAEDHLKGLITVGDIAEHYMNAHTKTMLAESRTSFKSIADTLDGRIVVGNEHAYMTKGKVLIGAALPEQLKEAMDPDDLILLSNREDAQLMAIASGASCLVLCMDAQPSEAVMKQAEEQECVIITTPLDTYVAARLIDQSIPIGHLMCKDNLLCFHTDDYIVDIKETMGRVRHRDFPVLTKNDHYFGTVSRRNLINAQKKKVILVDHSEVSQAVDNIEEAEILEIVDHHRIGSVETMQPIYFRGEPVGCTATILLQIYHEKHLTIQPTIAGLLCAAILSDTLMFKSPTCTAKDKAAAEELAEIAGIDIEEFGASMFEAGSNLKGKTPAEIFYQDYKTFVFGEVEFGVGQSVVMSDRSLEKVKDTLLPYMEEKDIHNNMIFFMLTNMSTETTYLLYKGEGAAKLIEEALHAEAHDGYAVLRNFVSRKKQLIPAFMETLQSGDYTR